LLRKRIDRRTPLAIVLGLQAVDQALVETFFERGKLAPEPRQRIDFGRSGCVRPCRNRRRTP